MAKKKSAKPSEQVKEFFRTISKAKEPQPLYLLFGDETFLLDKALQAVMKLALPDGINDFNFDVFYGNEADPSRVQSACETLALFGGRRLVLVREVQSVPASDLKSLTDYIKRPSPTTTLVFHGVTASKSLTKTTKFYKEMKKAGVVQEFKPLREWEVGSFVQKQARSRNIRLSSDIMDSLVQAIGTDLASLDGALERIDLYMGAPDGKQLRDVTEDVLAEVVTTSRSHEIFELTESIAARDLGRSLQLLREMMEQGQNPVGMNLMIARQMRQIWQVRCAVAQRKSDKEIARIAGMSPFFVDRYRTYAKAFTGPKLKKALHETLEADRLLKSSRLSNQVILERMILAICIG